MQLPVRTEIRPSVVACIVVAAVGEQEPTTGGEYQRRQADRASASKRCRRSLAIARGRWARRGRAHRRQFSGETPSSHFTPLIYSELHRSAPPSPRSAEDREAEIPLPRLTSRVRIPSPAPLAAVSLPRLAGA